MKTSNSDSSKYYYDFWSLIGIVILVMGIACNNKSEVNESLKDGNPEALPTASDQFNQVNTLTKTEQQAGWKLLFDGSSTDSWRSTRSESFPEHGWEIENGILSFVPAENGHGGGDIITKKQYTSFELSLEFKIEQGGNSGIKYNVVNSYPGHEGNYLGLEYQILDDKRHPDARQGRDGNRTVASLYDLIPASSDKKIHPVGTWNHVRIVIRGNQGEHWLNGDKVVSFEIGSSKYRELVAQSKYNIYENFGEVDEGHILLQAHGDPVSFRNIKIREL